jgi:hypothetical protein
MIFRKSLRLAFLSLAILTGILVLGITLLSFIYEKAAIRYMQKYLDEHLLTELSMSDIRFSILKDFPRATVELTNPVLLSGEHFNTHHFDGSYADTLLKAKSISFRFDLVKLLREDYEIKSIQFSEGSLNILIDHNHQHNVNVWKSSTSIHDTPLNLNAILLHSMRIRIISLPATLRAEAMVRRVLFKGSYAHKTLSGDARGGFHVDSLTYGNNTILRHAQVHWQIKLSYDSIRFIIPQGKLTINKASSLVAFRYDNNQQSFGLTVTIPKFGLEEIMSLVPFKDPLSMRDYSFSGSGRLTASIRGAFSGKNPLMIRSYFKLWGCKALNSKTHTAIRDISCEGSMIGSNPDNLRLKIKSFDAMLGEGRWDGSLTLNSIKRLQYDANINARIDLSSLCDFVNIPQIKEIKGFVAADLSASGNFKPSADSLYLNLTDLKKGHLLFSDAGITLRDQPWQISRISGRAEWDKMLTFDTLWLQVNNTLVKVNGSLANITEYLHRNGSLEANLSCYTESLNTNDILAFSPDGGKTHAASGQSFVPSDVHLKINLQANHFTSGKFNASEMSVRLLVTGDSIIARDYSLKFPDGLITGDAIIRQDEQKRMSIVCNSVSHRINIQQLFSAFNNFAQHFISDQNVRGQLSGSINFYACWDSLLRLQTETIKAHANIEIINGELVQFDPILKLSKYIRVEELRLIRFSQLRNTIYIKDRKVTIPEMAINSNAFNIKIAGQHSFDNVFDYRLRVRLSEVLFNKAQKKKKDMQEFLIEEDLADQPTIPLMILGTPDNYDVRFDRRKVFQGSRDNSSPPASFGTQPASNNFRIEWDDNQSVPQDEQAPINETEKDPAFEVEWNETENEL